MSIIHDTLKKVQQRLAPKTNQPLISPSTVSQIASAYLHESPPKTETSPLASREGANQESPIKNKIKSAFVLSCTIVIAAASILYFWRQFQNNPLKPSGFAQKPPTWKGLKPLAQFTINPPTGGASNTGQAAAPVTLNLQGIMSDSRGNLALINDRIYQEGDEVDGAKIVRINLDSITVSINGIEKTIFVKD